MTGVRPPAVYLFAAADTLAALGGPIRRAGYRLRRVEAIRPTPGPARVVSGRSLRPDAFDTLVVTSRHAFSRPTRTWIRARYPMSRWTAWAAGPGTAEALRRAGLRSVRRGRGLGAAGIAPAVGRSRRTILYLRSREAGPALARALRAQGHRVQERVTYRLLTDAGRVRRESAGVSRAAAVVFSSPSAVNAVRRVLGARLLRSIGRRVPALVLGERTARAVRAAGFRRVALAGTTTPQRLVGQLVRLIRDAAA